jgi:hypothetical protein
MSEDFKINFGDAKVIKLPDEGTYLLVVSDYVVKPAKNEESRSKGFNVSLIFQFVDPTEGHENFKVYHNLWVSYDNPWAAKIFFDALTGKELDSEMDLSDPNEFIGEKVMASLIHESYTGNDGTTKTKLAVASAQSFYPAPF